MIDPLNVYLFPDFANSRIYLKQITNSGASALLTHILDFGEPQASTQAESASAANQREIIEGVYGIKGAVESHGWRNAEGFNRLAAEVGRLGFDNAMIAKNAEIAALECCCKTNSNIGQLRFNMAEGFCSVNFNGERNTNSIIQNATIHSGDSAADLSRRSNEPRGKH